MSESLFTNNSVQVDRIIYTPSLFAKTNLIYLQETGTLTATTPHVSQRDHLNSYLFFIVKNGSGTLEYNNKTYNLNTDDCIFINCNIPYAQYTSVTNLWTLSWVHFNGPNIKGIYDKYIERGGQPSFTPKNKDIYINIISDIQNIANSNEYIKDMLLFQSLTTLLTQIMSESWSDNKKLKRKNTKRDVQDIKIYLNQHFKEKISLDMLAEIFYINKFYLTRIFKEQFGISVNNYILQLRITYAKQLLRFSDETITTIATECGISDANYFTRTFKKMEGCTPIQYRNQW